MDMSEIRLERTDRQEADSDPEDQYERLGFRAVIFDTDDISIEGQCFKMPCKCICPYEGVAVRRTLAVEDIAADLRNGWIRKAAVSTRASNP
jgi:hypothetical protein